MNKEPIFDLLAVAGKTAIEYTKLHPVAKISIDWTIDQVAERMKEELLSDVEKIRIAAKKFDIDKVVAIYLGSLNDKDLVAIRAYGKQSEAFIKELELQIIPENSPNDFLNDIHEKEQNFGILIYEKDDQR